MMIFYLQRYLLATHRCIGKRVKRKKTGTKQTGTTTTELMIVHNCVYLCVRCTHRYWWSLVGYTWRTTSTVARGWGRKARIGKQDARFENFGCKVGYGRPKIQRADKIFTESSTRSACYGTIFRFFVNSKMLKKKYHQCRHIRRRPCPGNWILNARRNARLHDSYNITVP